MVYRLRVSSSERSLPTTENEVPVDLVEVGVYSSSKEGFDHGLVVLALGDPFWLEPVGDGFRLLVEPHAAGRVTEHLACFVRESINWPPSRTADEPGPRKIDWITPLVWCALLVASFRAQAEWTAWTGIGVLDTQAVFERGEWWRLVTALFLHADVGHLVSNAISGMFVFAAVLSTMARWRAWLFITLAAVAGNLAAAMINRSSEYRSLGASTAVFAALGLLTGGAIRGVFRGNRSFRRRSLFVPIAAGLTVLGLYGAGDQQVDVIAHVTGFGAGLILGLVASGRPSWCGRPPCLPCLP
jgi:membrane associated rhomboid family serine protease